MPTATYIALANTTLTGTDTEIDFASIPSTYRDLVLIITNGPTNDVYLQFNADTGSNYSWVWASGQSAGAQSNSASAQTKGYIGFEGSGPHIVNIMDYSATDKHKTVLTRANAASNNITQMVATRWASTSAITSIKMVTDAANFPIGTTIALYGIIS